MDYEAVADEIMAKVMDHSGMATAPGVIITDILRARFPESAPAPREEDTIDGSRQRATGEHTKIG